MDANSLKNGTHVVIKLVKRAPASEEFEILKYFAEEPQRSNPRNKCICPLDILHPSDDAKHVMVIFPILRAYDSPQFDTVGEALDFIREMLEVTAKSSSWRMHC